MLLLGSNYFLSNTIGRNFKILPNLLQLHSVSHPLFTNISWMCQPGLERKKKNDCFSKPFLQRQGTKQLYINHALQQWFSGLHSMLFPKCNVNVPFGIGSFWLTPPLRISLQEYTKLGDLHPRVQERVKKVDPAEYSNMANPNTFSRCVFYF